MMTNDAFKPMGNRVIAIVQRIARLGWPAMVSCVFLLGAVASLAGAWVAHQQRLDVSKSLATLKTKQLAAPRSQPAAGDPLPMAPQDALFLDDLKALFKLAKAAGISLGVVEYKTERSEKLPLTLRSIELKVKEDYPKVKGFLSQVLADFPHASLQEIRIERADGLTAQGTLLIRLMLVYKSTGAGPQLATSPTQAAQ